jgi:hypothetical protein
MVSGREPVQEECATAQDKGRRSSGAEQYHPWPEVRDKLNRSLRGWSNYFGYGSRARHTVASTNTSSNVCAGSSRAGTRCKGAAIADSHSMSFIENSAESRMPEIGTSGLMSGDRGDGQRPKLPRPSSTLPERTSAASKHILSKDISLRGADRRVFPRRRLSRRRS